MPNEAANLVPRTLEALRKVGAPSSLTVLKRFGPSNPAALSFPIPGWTLADDVPAAAVATGVAVVAAVAAAVVVSAVAVAGGCGG